MSRIAASIGTSAMVPLLCERVHHRKEFEPVSGSVEWPGSDLSEPGLISRIERACRLERRLRSAAILRPPISTRARAAAGEGQEEDQGEEQQHGWAAAADGALPAQAAASPNSAPERCFTMVRRAGRSIRS